VSTPLTPEGHDSTIGGDPESDAVDPEELDDVTDDGTAGDGTLGDGEEGGDVLDEILDNHATEGWSDAPAPDGVGDPVEFDGGASGRSNSDPEANREF
jgi:hypothetical protein